MERGPEFVNGKWRHRMRVLFVPEGIRVISQTGLGHIPAVVVFHFALVLCHRETSVHPVR